MHIPTEKMSDPSRQDQIERGLLTFHCARAKSVPGEIVGWPEGSEDTRSAGLVVDQRESTRCQGYRAERTRKSERRCAHLLQRRILLSTVVAPSLQWSLPRANLDIPLQFLVSLPAA
ncbi:hypothetical protein JAAARDRAFT_346566 [Jaapia argillacea MUCL 33604]|uniref:Uncharacterized protein n=1 Tax=Jaapia argillacea MUCL 33604 TaxID=933084 RepID=A0A067PVH3_9AGAM|nr:hypothetical protein JAAARDRAFT_346566 [Jaapia argillacea MUCL 33604]